MKNTECTIYITTGHGRTWRYRREKNGWAQTGPTGIVHSLTAEQLLSHILPLLAAGNPGHLSLRVEPDVTNKDGQGRDNRRSSAGARAPGRRQERSQNGERGTTKAEGEGRKVAERDDDCGMTMLEKKAGEGES